MGRIEIVNRKTAAGLGALAILLSAGIVPACSEPAADTVIWGGQIYTAEPSQPKVQAVAVRAGRIVFTGDIRSARALVGSATRVVDLKGAALFPGFTDSHAHLDGVGQRELTLNLEGSASAAEVAARVRARVATARAGELIQGRGWIETGWPEHRFLQASDIDAVAPDNPVLLQRADGHAIVANTAALKLAGITAAIPVPFGGAILKDADGRLTGMLVDNAMALLKAIGPVQTEAGRREALMVGMAVENRYGWTGVHFMSAPWEDVLALEALATRGEAPLRVYAAVDRKDADKLFASGPRSVADGRVVTRAIKLYADGALGSRGAALFEPYADAPSTTGLLRLAPDDVRPVLARAAGQGIQICTHAIGDLANARVLDLYTEALPGAGREPRWRVEHAQNVRAADISRFARLGVIASMQPSHAIGDLHFAGARLGLDRLSQAYPWKTLLERGVVIAGGSDAPVERGDPLIEFYAAVTRHDLKGQSGPGWHPEQALSRDEALKLFTSSAAYARFAEAELGSIRPGKRADLTAFSVDLMTAPVAEIPKGHAVFTMVDGKMVWQAP
jgi:hypothetical protein